VESIIKKNLQGVIVESPHIDVLDELEQTRIVATYKINLIDLKNIAGLVRTMDGKMNKDSVLYWSIEPQSLDDFVRSQSNSGDASSNTNF
jgi:hypothetical protein